MESVDISKITAMSLGQFLRQFAASQREQPQSRQEILDLVREAVAEHFAVNEKLYEAKSGALQRLLTAEYERCAALEAKLRQLEQQGNGNARYPIL